jgi:lipopolysaccharide transport system permease protein
MWPFPTILVFTVVFHRIANLQAPGELPYALLVFAAMLPWQCRATALSASSAKVMGNVNLTAAA